MNSWRCYSNADDDDDDDNDDNDDDDDDDEEEENSNYVSDGWKALWFYFSLLQGN